MVGKKERAKFLAVAISFSDMPTAQGFFKLLRVAAAMYERAKFVNTSVKRRARRI